MPLPLSTNEIRRRWITFFTGEGHKYISSDSLVPQNDPSVLFTGAGMNQFKDHFLGRARLDHSRQRAVTVQKCIRTGDIDNVGRTPNHHTFFEMLGNFSFGDYFKKEAIEWAWRFCTDSTCGLGMEKDRLSVTIFGGDPKLGIEKDVEAEKWWKTYAPELQNQDGSWRIYEYGEHDNFWPADAPSLGPNGPCGPCSEIYYDTKPEQGAPERVAESKDPTRYVEVWNLVFTQFNRLDVGKLEPLSQKNIDTGAGLERMTRVLQQKSNNYETDLLFPIVQEVGKLANKQYGKNTEDDRRMRRITDHTRAAVFCIADGVAPKNEGRNYVVRRLMRRAMLDGRELGIGHQFLGAIATVVIQQMSVGYPELESRSTNILRTFEEEEHAFNKTLTQGRLVFAELVERIRKEGQKVVPGASAFRLWDTFGFPYELTLELANAEGLTVDEAGYKSALDEAIKISQGGFRGDIFESGPIADLKKRYVGKQTDFKGYDTLQIEHTRVLALIQNNKLVDNAVSGDALALLDATPFYAESGGQVGDRGALLVRNQRHTVLDTRKQEGLFLHQIKVDGSLHVGETLEAIVDPQHRGPTIKNHSATHLLHYVLRNILGTHVEQRGSLVSPERLRFDFTHFEQIKPEQLIEIEARVNAWVVSDAPVDTKVVGIDEAKAAGAMALFGEKYGDRVRMVTMGPSMELCGGTHVKSTGQIGYFRIISENSVAAGVRRIEALTGAAAVSDARKSEEWLERIAGLLKTRKETIQERIEALQNEKAYLERELESYRKKAANAAADALLSQVKDVAGAKLLAAQLENADAAGVRTTLDGIRKSLKEGAVVLGGTAGGKVALLVSLSPELVKRGAHAGNLLKEIAPLVGGKGGGKADMAQGGGPDVTKLPEALSAVPGLLGKILK